MAAKSPEHTARGRDFRSPLAPSTVDDEWRKAAVLDRR
ncbi:hypothetical protein TorRG33x02_132430 [Trema orientale]|uniref:Uncharacterized protein n=1 Tax=Trema orientale TaxID=63057 RepID=A0A2P5EZQ7_TREOI|nr:hypothetical protein TorRG33x02_132430 [Trema orientale]